MAKVKRKAHEKLSDQNIKHVISLLTPSNEGSKPITKKEACSILNISYNTTRLDRIIKEFEERQAFVERRKAENRGKAASQQEIAETIESYLSGENYTTIARRLFRSAGFIKRIIERIGVPQRPTGAEAKRGTDMLPDSCTSNNFEPGEVVWSAKYHRPARIESEVESTGDYLGKVYRIYVLEAIQDEPPPWFANVTAGGYFAYQPAYDLGKLTHLEQYGINLAKI